MSEVGVKQLAGLVAILVVASGSGADVAPKGMTQFNVVCPSRTLCRKLEAEYQRCKSSRKREVCSPFVDAMVQSFPVYDCQRPFDLTKTASYIVPALWLCEDPLHSDGVSQVEVYVELLSELRFKKARCTFASAALRSALDGAVAESFFDLSLEAEKSLKCPAAGNTKPSRDGRPNKGYLDSSSQVGTQSRRVVRR
jgi:hypothetical protein